MAELILPSGHIALVDDADLPLVTAPGLRWHLTPASKDKNYVGRRWREDGRYRKQRLHSFLTGWSLVDHINGDGMDNRRANLRPATHSQNNCNKGSMRTASSQHKGVSLISRRKSRPWLAQIKKDRRYFYLGYFDSQDDAARAYDAAARELHGEFAHLNFPTVRTEEW
ncbi:AP2 domain-containing protein [Actinoplanes palleronii]|uniref:AP2/ERF domain-containing protein n=1 Tax=Actinoplanes palleronii TaxID=113570 RepID=A0ABQ4BJB9_9ACTN|nr:AP2 domain-containing protein [Actinoplanes palleronii]GIE70775.1 hypothetical protein Apa02nite_068830 [Actinoplanes palleronii]